MTATQNTIPEFRIPELKKRVDRLNRRAERLGLDPIGFTVSAPYAAEWPIADGTTTRYVNIATVDVEIHGKLPVLDGAELLAAIDWVEDRPVVRLAPESEGVERPDSPRCEHCNRIRSRKMTAIIRRNGETMQVGTTCMKDFLGHSDPAAAVAWISSVSTVCEDDDFADVAASHIVWKPFELLTKTAAAIRRYGWVSRGQARDDFTLTATADIVRNAPADFTSLVITENDEAVAQDTIDWLATLEPDNDYLQNVLAVVGPDASFVRPEHLGIACSAIVARQRAKEQEIRDEAESKAAPAPEGRVEIAGTVERAYWKEDIYTGGSRPVWTVRTEEGWAVWGTIPNAALKQYSVNDLQGRNVVYTATLQQSPDKPAFAFGKRPAKVTVSV